MAGKDKNQNPDGAGVAKNSQGNDVSKQKAALEKALRDHLPKESESGQQPAGSSGSGSKLSD